MSLEIMPVKMSRVPVEERDTAKAMLKALTASVESRVEAGRLWLKLSSKTQGAIMDGTPAAFRAFWERLGKIGRGEVHPLLFDMSGNAAAHLAKLPAADQASYLNDGLPLVKDGRLSMVDPVSMSSAEVRQVFDLSKRKVKVRGLAAQRTYLRGVEERERKALLAVSRKKKDFKIERPGKWAVVGDVVTFDTERNADGLTLEELKAAMADMRRLYS